MILQDITVYFSLLSSVLYTMLIVFNLIFWQGFENKQKINLHNNWKVMKYISYAIVVVLAMCVMVLALTVLDSFFAFMIPPILIFGQLFMAFLLVVIAVLFLYLKIKVVWGDTLG